MALIADDAAHRVEQLLLMTERLAILAAEDTRRIKARQPLIEAETEEKNRLANAYRLELARIKQDHALIQEAPPALLAQLRQSTVALHKTLDAHELALGAVKVVSEGLVHAMAEEVVRQRGSGANYSAKGALDVHGGPSPTVLDRSA
ncbi:MAG: flagellar basal body protein [Alphaproteobacteria bacterium]|nr:flagellar basal body protein [Alphaproteobacteria bacterium]